MGQRVSFMGKELKREREDEEKSKKSENGLKKKEFP